jgi:putative hemolysin
MNTALTIRSARASIRLACCVVVAGLALAGCAGVRPSEPPPPPGAAPPQRVGLPNPATVACSRAGGVPVTERGPDGAERGLCRLPSGQVCDQWAFFRGECGTTPVDRRPGS